MKIFFILLLALIGHSAAADPSSDVKTWNEAYWSSWRSGDVEELVSLFSENAQIIWAYQGESANGRDELRELVKATLAAGFQDIHVEQISEKIIELEGGVLLVIDISEQTFPGVDGKPHTDVVRATTLYRHGPAGPVAHMDHASIAAVWE